MQKLEFRVLVSSLFIFGLFLPVESAAGSDEYQLVGLFSIDGAGRWNDLKREKLKREEQELKNERQKLENERLKQELEQRRLQQRQQNTPPQSNNLGKLTTVCAINIDKNLWYKLNVNILNGSQLNSYAGSSQYSTNVEYAVTDWGNNQYTIINIGPPDYGARRREGLDRSGSKWSISLDFDQCR